MIILKHIKYSQVVKTLKIEIHYGKNQLFSLNFAWKGTHLPDLKGSNSCQTNNFRIKCEPLQMVYSIKLCTRCAGYIKYTHCPSVGVRVMIMALNATFNNILFLKHDTLVHISDWRRGLRRRDRVVVGFTITRVISAYHQQRCEFEPCSPT
jgi:hypothetical protein